MIVSYPSPWQLARMIYDYWTVWVSLPNDDPWYQQTVEPSITFKENTLGSAN